MYVNNLIWLELLITYKYKSTWLITWRNMYCRNIFLKYVSAVYYFQQPQVLQLGCIIFGNIKTVHVSMFYRRIGWSPFKIHLYSVWTWDLLSQIEFTRRHIEEPIIAIGYLWQFYRGQASNTIRLLLSDTIWTNQSISVIISVLKFLNKIPRENDFIVLCI